MSVEKKTPIHKHAHPAYSWIALILAVSVILVVAGWYYLTYQEGLNEEVISSVKNSSKIGISSSSTKEAVNIDSEVINIQEEINSISDSDFSDAQLDDTILGIQ